MNDETAFINAMCLLRQQILSFEKGIDIVKYEKNRIDYLVYPKDTVGYPVDLCIEAIENTDNIKRVFIMGAEYYPSNKEKAWILSVMDAIHFIYVDLSYFRKAADYFVPIATDIAFELIIRGLSYPKIDEEWKHKTNSALYMEIMCNPMNGLSKIFTHYRIGFGKYDPIVYLYNVLSAVCDHIANGKIKVITINQEIIIPTVTFFRQEEYNCRGGGDLIERSSLYAKWYKIFNRRLLFGFRNSWAGQSVIISYDNHYLGEYILQEKKELDTINVKHLHGIIGTEMLNAVEKANRIKSSQNVYSLLGSTMV